MGKEPKDLAAKDPAGSQETEKAVISTVEDLEARYPELIADIRSQPNGKVETSDDLESFFPELVSEIRDEVLEKIGKCTTKQVKQNLPDLYQRIVMDLQSKSGPNLNVPGFLLELDDPFAQATLTNYQLMKGMDGMRLPCVLPFKDKGKGAVREEVWKNKFAKSEALKAEFTNVDAYIAFKSKAIVQALESYVLMAEGGGDFERAKAARRAMKKMMK